MWAGIAIGLAALAGLVLLGRYVATGGTRVGGALMLLVIGVSVTFVLAQLLGIYYRIPLAMVFVLVALLGVVGWLIVEVGRGIAWERKRLAALVGMLISSTVLVTLLMIALPAGGLLMPLFKVRAVQIAEANGFTALLVPDEPIGRDEGLPVDVLATPQPGLWITYKTFVLAEWKAGGSLAGDEMRALLAPGKDAMMPNGYRVSSDAVYESLTVGGAPALGVEFEDSGMDEKGRLGGGKPLIHVLLFERDGVQVRLLSDSRMVYQGAPHGIEAYSWQPALSFEELAAIGESLEPAR